LESATPPWPPDPPTSLAAPAPPPPIAPGEMGLVARVTMAFELE
jgi:hypothetical protein